MWGWDGATWAKFQVSTPPARAIHTMVYDVRRRRMVLFGGRDNSGRMGDTWEWDGAAWTEVTPAISPSPRESSVMAYDHARGRVVLFGGYGNGVLADTWEWDGATWTNPSPAQSPPARDSATMVYDPLRRVVVLFSGSNAVAAFKDTWEWNGSTWSEQAPALAPVGRLWAAMTYDFVRRSTLLFSGTPDEVTPEGDIWARGFESVAVPPERCVIATEDSDGDELAGCADPDCFGRCSPLCRPGETCDPALPRCGDGACSLVEDYLICPADCPAP
jgi:hypothetical protein